MTTMTYNNAKVICTLQALKDAGDMQIGELQSLRNMARDQLSELDAINDIIIDNIKTMNASPETRQRFEMVQVYRRNMIMVYQEACDIIATMV